MGEMRPILYTQATSAALRIRNRIVHKHTHTFLSHIFSINLLHTAG